LNSPLAGIFVQVRDAGDLMAALGRYDEQARADYAKIASKSLSLRLVHKS